ncbi:hypothetical protein, partial [Mycobacterium sp.]|uniref:hypothetical protein n=1 Tax=Mycobacterium sp. TaxID=1785 RepID=UPI002D7EBF8F
MRDYDPVGDRKRRDEDAADDELLETTADLVEAQRIIDKRYNGTTEFEQAQRHFDKHIDADRLRKVAARAANRDN